jgi:hypothetical protein
VRILLGACKVFPEDIFTMFRTIKPGIKKIHIYIYGKFKNNLAVVKQKLTWLPTPLL